MNYKAIPPRKRTSLGTLARQAKEIAQKVKKFQQDSGMNMDAESMLSYFTMQNTIEQFTLISEALDRLYQEQCKRKGR